MNLIAFSIVLLTLAVHLTGCATGPTSPPSATPLEVSKIVSATRFRDLSIEQKYAALKAAAIQLQSGTSPTFDFAPGLAKYLSSAIRTSEQFWAESSNFDELAKQVILPKEVLQTLGISARKTADFEVISAGVMHTYGYLFSTLQTSYGLKSKRWIESKLDQRLGFSAGLLSPDPVSGEFLANLTWILDQVTHQVRGCRLIRNVSPDLCKLQNQPPLYSSLGYLEQKAVLAKNSPPVWIRTHFIPLAPGGSDSHLLAYEIVRSGRRRWVTAFPIQEEFMKSLIVSHALAAPGPDPYKPRFNLFLDTKPESTLQNRGFFRTR